MKLEKIVGYLPHKLKVVVDLGISEEFLRNGVWDAINVVENTIICTIKTKARFKSFPLADEEKESAFDVAFNKIKPIFYPLSDLTKPITVDGYNDGKQFVPANILDFYNYGELLPNTSIFRNNGTIITDRLSYGIIQLLYKWHFDIHGLIERGEAIDINTLED